MRLLLQLYRQAQWPQKFRLHIHKHKKQNRNGEFGDTRKQLRVEYQDVTKINFQKLLKRADDYLIPFLKVDVGDDSKPHSLCCPVCVAEIQNRMRRPPSAQRNVPPFSKITPPTDALDELDTCCSVRLVRLVPLVVLADVRPIM